MGAIRVAVDARTLQGAPLGGVARSTLGHLRAVRDVVDLTLLTDARQPPVDDTLALDLPEVALRAPSRRGVLWLQLAAPRWLRSFEGGFHCPFYGLPFRQPVPMTATIHDITFEQHPSWFTREQRTVFRMQARHAARTARHLLTPSAFTRDEVCERYGLPGDRVSVAPNLLDASWLQPPPPRPPWLAERGVTGRYVLAMGGAWRRGVDLLTGAWPTVRAAAPDVGLVVVGEPGLTMPDGAVAVTGIADDMWRALLAGAEVLCYPTRHEGFGYPALEACAAGTAVLCGRVGALPEVLGDAAEWLPALTVESVTEALLALLADDARRAELGARGRARAAIDHQPEVATAVRRAFEAAAG
ncbi:MAG: glycosyltransferase [Acidimicrobiales bacterium]